jgi:hypothetical protein
MAADTGPGGVVLYFPPGVYRVAPGVLKSATRALTVRGDGAGSVRILAASDDDEALISLTHTGSSVTGLEIDGSGASGPLISVDASYCTVGNIIARNAGDAAIAVGAGGKAIVNTIHDVVIRSARTYGIHTSTAHPSTDCLISSVDVGRSGSSGLRFDSGGQVVTGVHSWASGRRSQDSQHGFEIYGKYCQLDNCQGETNAGAGLLIAGTALSTTVSGGRFWGNGGAGIDGGADRVALSGASIYRNGWGSPSGDVARTSGVTNRGGQNWRVSALNIWDDDQPVPALDATSREPNRISGRQSGPTQSCAFSDLGSSTNLSLLQYRDEDFLSGSGLYRG